MFRLSLVRLTGQGRHNREQESGAIAVIVALFVVLGVVLGLGAIVIDVGALHQERRIVQNGADAASLALAEICAKDSSAALCDDNTSDTKEYLRILAGDNAGDGLTDILSICGSGSIGQRFGTCPEPTDHLTDCVKKTLPEDMNYVEVRTRTQTGAATEGTLLKPFVAQAIGDNKGAEVRACARAAWGKASIAPLLPFTFSACEWYHDTGQDLNPPTPNYAPFKSLTLDPPESDPQNNLWERSINLNSGSDPDCKAWQHHDFPGGFGWLDYEKDTCKLLDPIPVVEAGKLTTYWYPGDTGVGAGNDCGAKMEAAVGTVVYLPVFDCADDEHRVLPCTGNLPQGTNVWYHMGGAAAFFLTGVDITGKVKKFLDKSVNHSPDKYASDHAVAECIPDEHGAKKCIYGWFVSGLVDPTAVIDGSAFDTGLKAIQMIG